VEQLQLLLSN